MEHPSGGPHQVLTARRKKRIPVLSFDYCQPILQEDSPTSSWKQRLLQVSSVASLLCVVDCTVLPLITILLSILGMAEQPDRLQWLHAFGHGMALYFVLPVGSLTTTINFVTHKRLSITGPALLGLMLIYIANCVMPHCSHGDDNHSMSHDDHSHHDHHTMMTHDNMHPQHEEPNAAPAEMTSLAMINSMIPLTAGQAHRITNVLGCALLLSSNYRAQRLNGCTSKECKHSKAKLLPIQVY